MMGRYVAFLRGMNVGGHRITNVELCAHFGAMGFRDVSSFLASGNVVFDAARGAPDAVAGRIEQGLCRALGYDVPTFLRTADEVTAIARRDVFAEDVGREGGKLQVALLAREPAASARKTVLNLATGKDRLTIHGRELYWLPIGRMTDSELDMRLIEATVGAMTIRTRKTIERLVARFFADA